MESESNDCWYAVYDGGYRQNHIDTGTLKPGEAKDYEFEEVGHFISVLLKTIKLTVNGIEFKPSEREGLRYVMLSLRSQNDDSGRRFRSELEGCLPLAAILFLCNKRLQMVQVFLNRLLLI